MKTVLLKSGTIVDGSGRPAFNGHLLIKDDKIDAIFNENDPFPDADTVIDATGLVVSPGFIDMHSHADWLLPSDDHPQLLQHMLQQGVTTVVGGNCGVSAAPINAGVIAAIKPFEAMLMDEPLEYRWGSMAEYFDIVEKARPVLNLAQLAGHGTIRYATTAKGRDRLSAAVLDKCLDQTRQCLEAGACGISFGLGYDPGMYAPLDELEAFFRVAAQAAKPVTVHAKAYSRISPCYPLTYLKPHNLRAVAELIDLVKKTGCALQFSHFIFVGRRSWASAEAALNMVDQARQAGLDIMIDAFPYTAGNTTINVLFPYWFLAMLPGGFDSRLARLRLRLELEAGFRLVGFSYRDFQVMEIGIPDWEDLNGMTITDIAKHWKISPFDTLLTIAQKSNGAALILFHGYSGEPGFEKPLEAVLSYPACLFETDVILKKNGHSNPAGLGAFPKILGTYVRDQKLIALEAAINRMTAKSAARFGIADRGLVAAGKAADLVVFDPQTISDSPGEGNKPAQTPKGIAHVFVNGAHAVENGSYVGDVRAGRVLRLS